ncbi:MAG: hypothetical protein Q4D17_11625, partial [Planctomycetia bacterium]|nr:hypothetical protein [Planctomycetia bacterium]
PPTPMTDKLSFLVRFIFSASFKTNKNFFYFALKITFRQYAIPENFVFLVYFFKFFPFFFEKTLLPG